MLAPGILLRAGQSSPPAVIETPGWWSCACDPRAITCGAQDIRSGLQRSLMTGGQRVGGPDTDRVDGVSTATRLPGRDQGHPRAEMLRVTRTARPQRDYCLTIDLPL